MSSHDSSPSILMSNRPNRFWATPIRIAALIAMALLAGCASHEVAPKRDAFPDEFAHWGEQIRPAGQPGEMVGLSDESRQVERNLGVR
jgi:hypothetical protein